MTFDPTHLSHQSRLSLAQYRNEYDTLYWSIVDMKDHTHTVRIKHGIRARNSRDTFTTEKGKALLKRMVGEWEKARVCFLRYI